MSIKTRSKPWLVALAAAAWCVSASAVAIEANQVRGEITSIDPDANELTLEVSEVGSDSTAREGSTETYAFDDDTTVRMEDPRTSVLGTTGTTTIDDLQEGTRVLLEFEEIDGRLVARTIGTDEDEGASSDRSVAGTDSDSTAGAGDQDTADIAAMESEGRDELPATASMLPFLALLGVAFAGLAAVLRIRRQR